MTSPVKPRRGRNTVSLPDSGPPVGSKASNLQWLSKHGARVPRTWVIQSAEDAENLVLPEGRYAVRSSARQEDLEATSAAGKYLTELDVELENVPAAVERVLSATESPDEMSAIIQEMVEPVLSGVAFSRNPVTGLSDTVVEAIEGRGDALLQAGSEPMRWVWRNGEFTEKPAATAFSRVIDDIVSEVQRLSAIFGAADLEWVFDGSDTYWVQIRPITTIEEVPLYSRRIAKDVMPGLIKPLVWSINVPMVNTAWVRLFTEAIGPNRLDPESLARSFAYRSYFDMRAIGDIFELTGMPRDSLENLLGLPGAKGRMRPGISTFVKLPRLIGLGVRLMTGAHRLESRRRQLHEELDRFGTPDFDQLSNTELLDQIDELVGLGTEAAYINIVIPLLANAHAKPLRTDGSESGLAALELHDRGEWDPTPTLTTLAVELNQMDVSNRTRAREGDLSALTPAANAALDRLIAEFGYLSENTNDLSTPRWRDDPTSVIRLAENMESNRPASSVGGETSVVRLSRKAKRAHKYIVLRDAAGATFGYAYGLLRPRFLELGNRLVARSIIEEPEDVFYVTRGTASDALNGESRDLRADVAFEKQSMEAVKDLIMPDLIVGDTWMPQDPEFTERLTGVGASRGRYRGTARFIGSLDEGARLGDGEILVVEFSDVAWTALFGKAGAVVTAAGGILAHSSITAREMGIPCVASVSNAHLLDGLEILVDGHSGEVFVEDGRQQALQHLPPGKGQIP